MRDLLINYWIYELYLQARWGQRHKTSDAESVIRTEANEMTPSEQNDVLTKRAELHVTLLIFSRLLSISDWL